jgi:competence protein ComEC
LLPEADLGWWRQAALRGWGSLLDSAGIGAAATVAGAPLVVSHFSLFSAGSLLANLVVVPLSFPVMCVGFFSLALGVSGLGVLAVPLNWIAGINLALLGAVVRFFSGLPGMAWALEYRVAWAGPVTALVLLGVFLAVPFGEVADDGRIRGWLFWVPPVIVAFSFLLAAG